jgi:hypothetical protein
MAKTFAQRVKDDLTSNASVRHMQAIRSENIMHPEVKRTFDAIPAAYRRERKWCGKKQDYVGPNQYVYLDASMYGSTVTLSISLHGLSNLKTDKRLARLLDHFITPEWTCKPTVDNTYSAKTPGRTYEVFKEVPTHRLSESHASMKWLRKNNRTWDLDHHLKTPLLIRVLINAYVKEDNETCRVEIAEVREEVVRTEIKRLVCA